MSKQTINIGASPNDGTGTPLRTSFDYTNQNFTELYTALGGGVGLPGATTQVIFNDGGTNLAGDAGLVYNKTTDALTVAGLVTAGSATITGDLTVDTNVLKVDTTNNRVGIGTATPASGYSLDVTGAAVGGIRASANNYPSLTVDSANSNGVMIYLQEGGVTQARIGHLTEVTGLEFSGNNGAFATNVHYGIGATGISTWKNVGGVAGTAMTLNSTGLNVAGKTAINGASLTYPLNVRASSSNVGNTAFLFEQLDGTPILTMRDNGTVIVAGDIRVGNTVSVVSPTAPNRTIAMIVNGVTLYIAAKTTND